MSVTFLELTNRVLKAFNEVQLTNSTFAGADGFYADAKDSVNMAIVDLYTEEDNRWPFAWDDKTFDTVIGTQIYTKATGVTTIKWDSFRIQRPQVSVSSITQLSGTATVTTATAHYLEVGDTVTIFGATPDDYNGVQEVLTVPTSTTFTFSVDDSLTSPATGTIVCYPPFPEKKLFLISYDQYLEDWLEIDRNTIDPESYPVPEFVVRMPNNQILITGKPDRVYPIVYEAYSIPDLLVDYDDEVVEDLELFQQAIIDKALHYAYMFRDNIEQASLAEDRYEKNVNKIRRMLITQDEYMKHD